MALESAGIIFKISADSSAAQADLKKFKSELNEIERAAQDQLSPLQQLAARSGMTAEGYDNLRNNVTMAAGAFAAIGTVLAAQIAIAVKVTTGLFDMARSAAEAGSQIKDMQDKTGLAAATLSTLQLAANQAGSSFEQIGAGIAKFGKLLGEAEGGGEKAQATLKALNVSTTELDKGLEQVIATIANAKEGTEQITLAQKAFGKSGADLIPVIKQINGDLEAARKEAERLGVTLTDEDVRAADDFGDTLETLSTQLTVASQRFALTFAPTITRAMSQISEFLARNQEAVRVWGGVVNETIIGTMQVFSVARGAFDSFFTFLGIKFADSAAEARFWAEAIIFSISPVLGVLQKIGSLMNRGQVGADMGGTLSPSIGMPSIPRVSSGGGGGRRGGGGGGGETAEEKERKKLQATQDRINAEIKLEELKTDKMVALEEYYYTLGKTSLDELTDFKLKSEMDLANFRLAKLREEYTAATGNAKERLRISNEIQEQEERIVTLGLQHSKERAEIENKRFEDAIKAAQELFELEQQQTAEVEKRLEVERKAREEEREAQEERMRRAIGGPSSEGAPGEEGGGFFGGLQESLDDATGNIRDFEDVLTGLGNTAAGVFMQMGQGLGNMVQQWVLLGGQADISMRKMVASVLAGVAAQAATLAVFHLAMGIVALTPWGAAMYGPASNHFIAAAIWGSIAVGAALAGRAIAGDSFQKQTTAAAGASASGASGDTSSQGQQFSGRKDQVVDVNANQPGKTTGVPVTVTLRIADDSTWLGKMLKADVEQNGQARQQIKLIAADA